MERGKYPLALLGLLVFIGIVNGLANEFSLYWRIPWFDMPMHFLGGLWVGGTILWWRAAPVSPRGAFGIALAAVLVIGGLWELFEFGLDTFVHFSEQNSATDTASDIFFDIIGGTVAAAYVVMKKNKL